MLGMERIKATAEDVSAKFAAAAADTRKAMGALAVLGVVALVVALIALGVGLRARHA